MAFVLTSPNKPLSVAGPFDAAGLVYAFGKIDYGEQFASGSTMDVVSGSLGMAESFGSIIVTAMYNYIEDVTMKNSIMCLTPKDMPKIRMPYLVMQRKGGTELDDCLPIFKPKYCVIFYDTHSGVFSVDVFDTEEGAINMYTEGNKQLCNTASEFEHADKTMKGPLPFNNALFTRVPQGIFRNNRRVTIRDRVITFKDIKSMGHIGIAMQGLGASNAKSLDGKTGSWEKLLKVSHIKHKIGSENAPLASSIADFIGLWACVTGDITTITTASEGRINGDDHMLFSKDMYIKCLCCSSSTPETHTRVKYRWDTVGAWV